MKNSSTVKWILNSMGKGRSVLALLTILSSLNAVITTFSALITMNIVDSALGKGDLWINVLYYGCVLFITLMIQIAQVYLTNKYTINLDIHYRNNELSGCLIGQFLQFSVKMYTAGTYFVRNHFNGQIRIAEVAIDYFHDAVH